jgi:hypothetical protein
MNHDLHCLVYVSSSTCEMSPTGLEQLLRKARLSNSSCAITGVLLYSGGNFMQVLEGPRPAVMDTYSRIRLSKLHRDVIELTSEAAPCRQFAGWSMAYSRATWDSVLRIQEAFSPDGPQHAGMDLLQNFWLSSRAAAHTRPPAALRATRALRLAQARA